MNGVFYSIDVSIGARVDVIRFQVAEERRSVQVELRRSRIKQPHHVETAPADSLVRIPGYRFQITISETVWNLDISHSAFVAVSEVKHAFFRIVKSDVVLLVTVPVTGDWNPTLGRNAKLKTGFITRISFKRVLQMEEPLLRIVYSNGVGPVAIPIAS